MRGLVDWKRGNERKAAADLGRLAEDFRNGTLFATLGSLYIAAGMTDEALRHNEEAREFDPSNSTIADNLGRSYYVTGRVEESEEIFDELIEKGAHIPEPYRNKALILEERGDTNEAAELVERAKQQPYSHLSYFSPEDIDEITERIEAKTHNE